MLVQGHIEVECVFGRLGCVNASMHSQDPYRDVEIPVGTVWEDGAEFVEKHQLDCDNPPLWVLRLPPDGEWIAIWKTDRSNTLHPEFYPGYIMESWSPDYPESAGFDGSGFTDDEDWWEDWSQAPCYPPSAEQKALVDMPSGELDGMSWDEDIWSAFMHRLHEVGAGLLSGRIPGDETRRMNKRMRPRVVKWYTDALKQLRENQFRIDIDLVDWTNVCAWCGDELEFVSEHPTLDGLIICEGCGPEYDQIRDEVWAEAKSIAKKEGRTYRGVMEYRGGPKDPWKYE